MERYDIVRLKFPSQGTISSVVPASSYHCFSGYSLFRPRESWGSNCGVVRGRPGSLYHPPFFATLNVALACAKLRAINVATSEFFVNSQAVYLSLPMIRSLRCLRNAKGPSPSNSVEIQAVVSRRR